ncbi:MAG: TRAP transporter fused permease subunit [Rhodospirillaceae bacterium]|nr:TRAP transporter fused permease subunit [Rhodospirillaceae bacterium]
MEAVETTATESNDAPAPPSPVAQALTPWLGIALAVIGLLWSSGIAVDLGIEIIAEQVMCAVLGLAFTIVYLNVPAHPKYQGKLPWFDALAAALGFVIGAYLIYRYPELLENVAYMPIEASIVGFILVTLTTEALCRTAGWGLCVVLFGFFAYAFLGDLVPGSLKGRAMAPETFFSFLGIDTTGLLGIPLTIITTVVIIFIFLGQVLLRSGGSEFFTDAAAAIMGRSRGGSAKIAVVASGLFGSISGSAVSNVASTGVITIPLMRQGGYTRPVAAAIEAVASTGGQIMPPIMGAAAFLMAELLEIRYQEVIVAAILPALLYYIAVFLQADLEAGKTGIKPVPEDQIPPILRVLKEGWYFITPFAVLISALFYLNAPPETAALFGAATIVVLGLIFSYKGKKLTLSILVLCLRRTGEMSVDILVIGAAAGMIIGILDATGLSFGLTFLLVQVGEGSLFILLSLTAVICIILGMGMPTTAIYFLLAVLATPPLIELGVEPIAAHLFVLYFGLMSMITPPVALAAFTAAKLAETNPMRTAVAACRFGWPAFVVPFLFVIAPNLIMIGEPLDIAVVFVTAVAGIWFASAGMTGFLQISLSVLQRAGYIIGGLGLLLPSQSFDGAYLVEIAGGVICGFIFLSERAQKKAVLSH